MFVCQITGAASAPGDKCHKVVIAKRARTYYEDYFNEETREWEQIEVGRGWEIVKEVNATEDGVSAWNSLSDADRERFARDLMKGKL